MGSNLFSCCTSCHPQRVVLEFVRASHGPLGPRPRLVSICHLSDYRSRSPLFYHPTMSGIDPFIFVFYIDVVLLCLFALYTVFTLPRVLGYFLQPVQGSYVQAVTLKAGTDGLGSGDQPGQRMRLNGWQGQKKGAKLVKCWEPS